MMDVAFITTVTTLFSLLANGIELRKALVNETIDVSLKVKKFFIAKYSSLGKAVLAFVVVTNRSQVPLSITDFNVVLDDQKSERVPITELRFKDSNNTYLTALSFGHVAYFDLPEAALLDLRNLTMDIYLRPNESKSGLVLFKLPDVKQVANPELELHIGDELLLKQPLPSTHASDGLKPL